MLDTHTQKVLEAAQAIVFAPTDDNQDDGIVIPRRLLLELRSTWASWMYSRTEADYEKARSIFTRRQATKRLLTAAHSLERDEAEAEKAEKHGLRIGTDDPVLLTPDMLDYKDGEAADV